MEQIKAQFNRLKLNQFIQGFNWQLFSQYFTVYRIQLDCSTKNLYQNYLELFNSQCSDRIFGNLVVSEDRATYVLARANDDELKLDLKRFLMQVADLKSDVISISEYPRLENIGLSKAQQVTLLLNGLANVASYLHVDLSLSERARCFVGHCWLLFKTGKLNHKSVLPYFEVKVKQVNNSNILDVHQHGLYPIAEKKYIGKSRLYQYDYQFDNQNLKRVDKSSLNDNDLTVGYYYVNRAGGWKYKKWMSDAVSFDYDRVDVSQIYYTVLYEFNTVYQQFEGVPLELVEQTEVLDNHHQVSRNSNNAKYQGHSSISSRGSLKELIESQGFDVSKLVVIDQLSLTDQERRHLTELIGYLVGNDLDLQYIDSTGPFNDDFVYLVLCQDVPEEIDENDNYIVDGLKLKQCQHITEGRLREILDVKIEGNSVEKRSNLSSLNASLRSLVIKQLRLNHQFVQDIKPIFDNWLLLKYDHDSRQLNDQNHNVITYSGQISMENSVYDYKLVDYDGDLQLDPTGQNLPQRFRNQLSVCGQLLYSQLQQGFSCQSDRYGLMNLDNHKCLIIDDTNLRVIPNQEFFDVKIKMKQLTVSNDQLNQICNALLNLAWSFEFQDKILDLSVNTKYVDNSLISLYQYFKSKLFKSVWRKSTYRQQILQILCNVFGLNYWPISRSNDNLARWGLVSLRGLNWIQISDTKLLFWSASVNVGSFNQTLDKFPRVYQVSGDSQSVSQFIDRFEDQLMWGWNRYNTPSAHLLEYKYVHQYEDELIDAKRHNVDY